MKKTLFILLILILLAPPATAFAQGKVNHAALYAQPQEKTAFSCSTDCLLPLNGSAPNVSETREQLPARPDAKPDIGLYLLISLVPLSALVVGVLWAVRFKEKHIDGK